MSWGIEDKPFCFEDLSQGRSRFAKNTFRIKRKREVISAKWSLIYGEVRFISNPECICNPLRIDTPASTTILSHITYILRLADLARVKIPPGLETWCFCPSSWFGSVVLRSKHRTASFISPQSLGGKSLLGVFSCEVWIADYVCERIPRT